MTDRPADQRSRYVAHGPDAAAVKKGSELDTSKPERSEAEIPQSHLKRCFWQQSLAVFFWGDLRYSGTLAFMWETRLVWARQELSDN